MAGGFEPNPLPCFHDKIPEKFEFQLLDENWEQFSKLTMLNLAIPRKLIMSLFFRF